MEQFKSYITEEKDEPYKLLILSHDDPLDPNETAPMVRNKAEKLGIVVYLAEFMGAYMEDTDDGKLFYSYPVDKSGHVQMPDMKKDDVKYDKPFKINSKNTLIMVRGLNAKNGCASWWTMVKILEHDGFKVVNSTKCNEICNDKWYNQIIFQRNNIKTPNTVLIRHVEGAIFAAKKLGNKYPMILKTSIGSQGVGVMWVESSKALVGIVQLLYRENEFVDIILQEYIKTDYDVRVVVVGNKILGAMKRPIIDGDFRSNVSQGSEPEVHEITEMEAKESLRAAKSVDGDIVGVDFIPSKNREKDSPLFIEVNSTPGLMGIESTFSKGQIDSKLYKKALKKERGKFSITSEILSLYKDRSLWTKSGNLSGRHENFKHKTLGELVGTMDTGNSAVNSVIHADSYDISGKTLSLNLNGKTLTTSYLGDYETITGAGNELRPKIKLDLEFGGVLYKDLPFTVDDRSGKSTLLMNIDFLIKANLIINPAKEYIFN